jgi:hypothetical protein
VRLRLRDVRKALATARALIANYQKLGLDPGVDVLVVILGCRHILKHHRRRHRRRRHRTARLGLSFTAVEKGRSPVAEPITITPTQDVLCEVHPVDAAGNPTTPTVEWISSNPAVISLTPAADGLSARGVSLSEGIATITAQIPGSLPAVSEDGVVTVGIVTPPPPPPTTGLGLTLAAVDKGINP